MSNELDGKPEIGESSASNTAQKPKKVPGRPFTKETAKQAAINAGKAHRMRKKVRAMMLASVVNSVDIGEEMVKALKDRDSKLLDIIEKAVKIIGLHYDQSEDAAQNLNVKADVKAKGSGVVPLNIVFTDAKKVENPEDDK